MMKASTAEENQEGLSIRRGVDFSRRAAFDDISVYNLFAYRATDPAELGRIADPIGPENKAYLTSIPLDVPVIAAWGIKVPTKHYGWLAQVKGYLCAHKVFHFGLRATGQPRHPLMLPKSTQLQEWRLS